MHKRTGIAGRACWLVPALFALSLAACGGGSSGGGASSTSYTVSGAVAGLASGQSLQLLNNGAGALTVSANGGFAFAQKVSAGGSYAVTVDSQPGGQYCSVTNGSGASVHADVSDVAVDCTSMHVYDLTHLYVTELNSASVSQFSIGNNGALTPMSTSTVSSCVSPVLIALDPAASYAYVDCGSTAASIEEYSVGSNGSLLALSPASVATGPYPFDLAIDPAGRYLYASSAGSANALYQYLIGSNGQLTPMSTASVPAGTEPQGIVIGP